MSRQQRQKHFERVSRVKLDNHTNSENELAPAVSWDIMPRLIKFGMKSLEETPSNVVPANLWLCDKHERIITGLSRVWFTLSLSSASTVEQVDT